MGNGHMGLPCEQTDMTENITFPQLSFTSGKNLDLTTSKRI